MTTNPIQDLTQEEMFLNLDCKKNSASKKLLDTLVIILKEEYIRAAKANPEIFTK